MPDIGVYIKGKKAVAAAVADGRVSPVIRTASIGADPAAAVADLVKSICDKPGKIGIAVDGVVDYRDGRIIAADGFASDYPLAEKLAEATGCANVAVAKTADALAMGMHDDVAGRDAYSFILLTLDEHIGCSIIIGGKPYGGFDGAGAEFAHTTVAYGKRACRCGRTGCFEAYVSPSGLLQFAREHGVEAKSAHDVFVAAARGCCKARDTLEEYNEYLSCGVTNLINLFQPNSIAIGGELALEGDALIAPLSAVVARDQYARNSPAKTGIFAVDTSLRAVLCGAVKI
jgi:glucokinase